MDSARLSAAKSSPMMETINMVSVLNNERVCLPGSVILQSLQATLNEVETYGMSRAAVVTPVFS